MWPCGKDGPQEKDQGRVQELEEAHGKIDILSVSAVRVLVACVTRLDVILMVMKILLPRPTFHVTVNDLCGCGWIHQAGW